MPKTTTAERLNDLRALLHLDPANPYDSDGDNMRAITARIAELHACIDRAWRLIDSADVETIERPGHPKMLRLTQHARSIDEFEVEAEKLLGVA